MRDLAHLLADEIARHPVPGVAVGLLADGHVTTACAGVTDTRTGRPAAVTDRFAIGSLTKSLTATVLLRLTGEGRFALDDPLPAHVPELVDAAWAGSTTVRDLLANRSRLPLRAEWEFSALAGDDDEILARFASALAGAPASPVGWSYSNAGWSLLGRLIECLTGETWEAAMREHLFTPLGMAQTTFAGAELGEVRAVGHEVVGDTFRPLLPWTPRVFGPSGTTVLSSIGDIMRFAQFHLDEPAMEQMRELHADVAIHGWLDGWCLGWARFDWAGGPAWGWDGVISGQRAILRLLPERRAALAILTNGSAGRNLCRSLLAGILDEHFGLAVPPLRLQPSPGAQLDLDRYVGTYAWPDRAWRVSARGNGLLIEGADRTDEALPVDERIFVVDPHDPDNPTVTFDRFDSGGRPSVLFRMLWAYHRQVS
jgi:CubicO group peptidase (beta-lactamase class C family)